MRNAPCLFRSSFAAVWLFAACGGSSSSGGEAAPQDASSPPAEAAAQPPAAPPPPSAAASAVAALMEAEQKTEDAPPPSDRFRRTYLTTEEITRDASLAREIDSLADSDRGQAVFEALASRKEEVLPVLRRALWHQKPNVRTHVAKMLHLYEDRTEETTDALIDLLLHDADADVRSVVARVLVSHKSRRAVPALMEVVSTDPFVHARANAVRALGELRDPQAAAVVQKALHDKESWVRLRALGAVEELGLRAAKAQVELMTRDPNIEVKKKAEKVLRSL